MRKLIFILFLFSQAYAQSPLALHGTVLPTESAAQRVTNTFVSINSLSGNDYRAVKKLTASLERDTLYYKILQLCVGKFWTGTYAHNLVNPLAYDYSFRSKMKAGTVTTSENGIVIGTGDTLNTYMIYDNMSSAPNSGVFWYSKYGVSQVIVHSASPFRVEPKFNNKAYSQIGNSALGVTVPAVPPGFCYAQRLDASTVEFYQGNVKYQEALAFGSYSPAQNDIYFVGNGDSSYILKVWGFTSVLTEAEVGRLNNIINEFVTDLAGTAEYTPVRGINEQIWKAIRTSFGAFETAMDGRRCVSYKDTLFAMGGWTADSTNHRFWYSVDKGVTWHELPPAPWSPTNDFMLERSVTGDTFVKWGGDNSLVDNKRIDIYTSAGGWQLLNTWSAGAGNGIGLTGTRHKHYFYDIDPGGDIYRFTLPAATRSRIRHVDGDTAITRGFMISLPSGRLIMGAGYVAPGTTMTGKLWYSDDDGMTWTFMYANEIFETYWPTCTVTKTAVIYWAGRNDVGNQKGVYWISIEDLQAGLDNWHLLDWVPIPVHAQGACVLYESNQITDEVAGVQGNIYNHSWLFKRIDTGLIWPVFIHSYFYRRKRRKYYDKNC